MKPLPEWPVPELQPAEALKTMAQIAKRTPRVLARVLTKQAGSAVSTAKDEFGIARAFLSLWAQWLKSPMTVAQAQWQYARDASGLLQTMGKKLLGQTVDDAVPPAPGDGRFKADAWRDVLWFDFLKQAYLLTARATQGLVGRTRGLSPEHQKKVEFFTRQFVDAMSPTNFALLNPAVITETVRTGGLNLLKGFSYLLEDLERGDGELAITMTDTSAFTLGKDIATTPGKVVARTSLCEVIQFDPSTPNQYKRPLLVIPPWINKYYILDLREKNSFIRWATSQGHTVFVLSWVNPDVALAKKGFDDYMTEGPLAALDAIEAATGERSVNAIGYCLGGTLLGSTLGYLAAKGDDRIASATFFVSLLDFSIPGDLGVFIDEAQVDNLERRMNERGYLEASEMAATFNLLRANDLVWGFAVNRYLLGKAPAPFDLLYWNADSTRMPAAMHGFYLRNMYLKNLLRKPNGISLEGTPIDLSKVKAPAYFVSTAEDHIAPWQSTYLGSQALGGPVRFVLGGSGHIAGIVNPPSANKYGYLTNDERAATPEDWQRAATKHDGSWWTDWQRWVAPHAGEQVAARRPGERGATLGDAPGSYVTARF
jgi:polyhydroxyalkanoate synthase subunit PhaC